MKIIYTKRDKRTPEERETINNFFKPENMSIWDNIPQEQEDNSGSRFLNKALTEGSSLTLTFEGLEHQEQREGTPEEYRTPDGKEWNFYFTDEQGRERQMTCKSTRARFFEAMRDAKVEPKDVVTISRTGAGLETQYTVVKAGGETKTDEIPF